MHGFVNNTRFCLVIKIKCVWLPCVLRYGRTVSFLAFLCSSVRFKLNDKFAAGSAYCDKNEEKGRQQQQIMTQRVAGNDIRKMRPYGLRFFKVHFIDIGHIANNVPHIDDSQVSCWCSLMVRIRLIQNNTQKKKVLVSTLIILPRSKNPSLPFLVYRKP